MPEVLPQPAPADLSRTPQAIADVSPPTLESSTNIWTPRRLMATGLAVGAAALGAQEITPALPEASAWPAVPVWAETSHLRPHHIRCEAIFKREVKLKINRNRFDENQKYHFVKGPVTLGDQEVVSRVCLPTGKPLARLREVDKAATRPQSRFKPDNRFPTIGLFKLIPNRIRHHYATRGGRG